MKTITDNACEHIYVREIRVNAQPGSHIMPCLYESAILALLKRTPVVLVHNQDTYILDPDAMMKPILSQNDPPVNPRAGDPLLIRKKTA